MRTTSGGAVLTLIVNKDEILPPDDDPPPVLSPVQVRHVRTRKQEPLALDVFTITHNDGAPLTPLELLTLQERIERTSGRLISIEDDTHLTVETVRDYPELTQSNRQLISEIAAQIVTGHN